MCFRSRFRFVLIFFSVSLGLAAVGTFFLTAVHPAVAAPTAPTADTNVIIYDDLLAPNWIEDIYDTDYTLAETDVVFTGTNAISAAYRNAWAGVIFRSQIKLDNDDYTAVRFRVHGGPEGGHTMVIRLTDGTTGFTPYYITPTAGVWTTYTIPLNQLGNPPQFDGIGWQEFSGGLFGSPNPVTSTFGLDRIELLRRNLAPEPLLIYTDTLNADWNNYSWSTSINFTDTTTVFTGTNAISAAHRGTYSGLFLNSSTPITGSRYQALSFRLHGGLEGGQSMGVNLVYSGTFYSTYVLNPQPNTWQQVTIPLADLENPLMFDGIVFLELNGTLSRTFHLDDIRLLADYRLGEPDGPVTTLYDETTADGWYNASWAPGVDLNHNTVVFTGSNAISATYQSQWDGVYLQAETPYNGRSFETLRFRYHGGDTGGQAIGVGLTDGDQFLQPQYIYPTPNQWQTAEFRFVDLGAPAEFDGIYWMEFSLAGGPYDTFHLDQIELTAAPDDFSHLVAFDRAPTDWQLYPREPGTDQASIPISGTVSLFGFDTAGIRLYREGVFLQEETQPLSYTLATGTAPFSFTLPITAETAAYQTEFYLTDQGNETIIGRADHLVGGDVLLIQGQSNATASIQQSFEVGVYSDTHFVRSFGTTSADPDTAVDNNRWYRADGNSYQALGSIGQWGMAAAQRLVENTGIPVAVINGGHAGQSISFFARNDADPLDPTTNYGRLLRRVRAAGVQNHIRAILWYQGEGNAFAPAYADNFDDLYTDWHTDYGPIEQIYMHQIRTGCGGSDGMRDLLRTLPVQYADVTAIATTGLNGHDGCHFTFTDGYETLGGWVHDLLGRDLYGYLPASGPHNIESPNPAYAFFNGDGTELTVVTRNLGDELVWEPGAEALFALPGSAVTVTGGTAGARHITLQLAGDGRTASGISHVGRALGGPWVRNSRGLGLFTFYDLAVHSTPISAIVPPITLTVSAGDAHLTWTDAMGNCDYELFYDADPYFTPGTSTAVAETAREHTQPAGPTGFYQLHAVGCGMDTAVSPTFGHFQFGITAGD